MSDGGVPATMVSDFIKNSCEEASVAADPALCEQAHVVQENLGRRCPGAGAQSHLTPGEMDYLSIPPETGDNCAIYAPDMEGYVSVASCVAIRATKHSGSKSPRDAEEWCMMKTSKPGKISCADLESPSYAEAAKQTQGCDSIKPEQQSNDQWDHMNNFEEHQHNDMYRQDMHHMSATIHMGFEKAGATLRRNRVRRALEEIQEAHKTGGEKARKLKEDEHFDEENDHLGRRMLSTRALSELNDQHRGLHRRLMAIEANHGQITSHDVLDYIQNGVEGGATSTRYNGALDPAAASPGMKLPLIQELRDTMSHMMPQLDRQMSHAEEVLSGGHREGNFNYLTGEMHGTGMANGPAAVTVAPTHPVHNMMEPYNHMGRIKTNCTSAMTYMDTAITAMKASEDTDRATLPAGNFYGTSYYSSTASKSTRSGALSPTSAALDASKEAVIADCLDEMLHMEPPPHPPASSICYGEFESMEKSMSANGAGMGAAGSDDGMIYMRWSALTHDKGCFEDEHGCVDRFCFESMPSPVDPGSSWHEVAGMDGAHKASAVAGEPAPPAGHVPPGDMTHVLDVGGVRRLTINTRTLVDWKHWEQQQRRLQTADTIAPMTLQSDGLARPLPAGAPLDNPADVEVLTTGCMPWQMSLDKFKTTIKGMVAAGARGAEAGSHQIADALLGHHAGPAHPKTARILSAASDMLGGWAGSVAPKNEIPKDIKEKTVKSAQRLVDQRRGKCPEGDSKCDPTKADASVNDDEISRVFNMLDKAHSGCIDPEIPEAFDCDSFGESALTLIDQGSTPDGLPTGWAMPKVDEMGGPSGVYTGQGTPSDPSSPMQAIEGGFEKINGDATRLDWGKLCREKKEAERLEHEVYHFVDTVIETGAQATASARLRQRLLRRMERHRELTGTTIDMFIHPTVRKLARMPEVHYDHQGNVLDRNGNVVTGTVRELHEIGHENLNRALSPMTVAPVTLAGNNQPAAEQSAAHMAGAHIPTHAHDVSKRVETLTGASPGGAPGINTIVTGMLTDDTLKCSEFHAAATIGDIPMDLRDDLVHAGDHCKRQKKNDFKTAHHNTAFLKGKMGSAPNTDGLLRTIEKAAANGQLPVGNVAGVKYPRTKCQAIVHRDQFSGGDADVDDDGVPDVDELAYCAQQVMGNMDIEPHMGEMMQGIMTGQSSLGEMEAELWGQEDMALDAASIQTGMNTVMGYEQQCFTDCHFGDSNDRLAACRDETVCSNIFHFGSANEIQEGRYKSGEARANLDYTRRLQSIERRKRQLKESGRKLQEVNKNCLSVNGEQFCATESDNKRRLVEEWAARGVSYVVNTREFDHKKRYLKTKRGKAQKAAAHRALSSRGGAMPKKGSGIHSRSLAKSHGRSLTKLFKGRKGRRSLGRK